jgi:hypothetical protein
MSDVRQGRPAPDSDPGPTRDPVDVPESRENYVTPDLADLGSFQELTELNPGGNTDLEGSS